MLKNILTDLQTKKGGKTLSTIVVGVVGAGRIGKIHIANMIQLPNVRIKTVADPFADELQEWFETSGAENLTDDYQEIINDHEIDVLFICSPTDTHIALIEAAAEKSKHVFCEKPISFSHEETLGAFEKVKKSGIKVQIGFNRRFDRNFASVRKAVSKNEIGNVHMVKITSRDPEAPPLDYVARSGGIFFDMTIHDFDMARFLADSEVEEIYAQGGALVNPDIAQYEDIDTAVITLKYKNGAYGVIDNSRQAVYGYDQRVEVFGSKGQVVADNETETRVKLFTEDLVKEDKPLYFFLERYMDAFVEEITDFFTAIQDDEEVSPSFEDGIKAQQLAFAAKESYLSGKPVKVDAL